MSSSTKQKILFLLKGECRQLPTTSKTNTGFNFQFEWVYEYEDYKCPWIKYKEFRGNYDLRHHCVSMVVFLYLISLWLNTMLYIHTHTHSTFMEVSKMPTVAYTVLMKHKDENVWHVDKNHFYSLLSDTSCGLSSLNYLNFDFLKWHCTVGFKLSWNCTVFQKKD